jgi:hypothetical protein
MGSGPNGTGKNQLGIILMMLRAKLSGRPSKFPKFEKLIPPFDNAELQLQLKNRDKMPSFAPTSFPKGKPLVLDQNQLPTSIYDPPSLKDAENPIKMSVRRPMTSIPSKKITKKASKPGAPPIMDLTSWMERADLLDKNDSHHPYPPNRNWKGADFLKHHAVTFFYNKSDKTTYWLTNFVTIPFEVEEGGKKISFPSSAHYFHWEKVKPPLCL